VLQGRLVDWLRLLWIKMLRELMIVLLLLLLLLRDLVILLSSHRPQSGLLFRLHHKSEGLRLEVHPEIFREGETLMV
jgi:hypothetical protein